MMVALSWWCIQFIVALTGYLGKVQLAAQAVLFQIVTTSDMVSYGMSTAAGMRIGNLLGSGDHVACQTAYSAAIVLSGITSALPGSVLTIFRSVIAHAFTEDSEVADLVTQVLPILTIYLCIKNVVTVLGGVVRGIGHQRFGACVTFLAYYAILTHYSYIVLMIIFPLQTVLGGVVRGIGHQRFGACVTFLAYYAILTHYSYIVLMIIFPLQTVLGGVVRGIGHQRFGACVTFLAYYAILTHYSYIVLMIIFPLQTVLGGVVRGIGHQRFGACVTFLAYYAILTHYSYIVLMIIFPLQTVLGGVVRGIGHQRFGACVTFLAYYAILTHYSYIVLMIIFPLQTVLGGVVRGIGHQRFGACVTFLAYYAICLPLGLPLMFLTSLGIAGIWIAYCVSTASLGVCFLVRLNKIDWKEEVVLAQARTGANRNCSELNGGDYSPLIQEDCTSDDEDSSDENPARINESRVNVKRIIVSRLILVLSVIGILAFGIIVRTMQGYSHFPESVAVLGLPQNTLETPGANQTEPFTTLHVADKTDLGNITVE
ncbi:multidrug and toxin extrusion protein 1-like [Haliotis rufescens]|uniref:multidrug and toxin extrusion protein 1-like n=1 Tax=Haliotis rufescens TaxID=6454 RepID=UPI00201F256D|nr:multidrug and toxin extrusion protein 1-like [Haliotis rufescens]